MRKSLEDQVEPENLIPDEARLTDSHRGKGERVDENYCSSEDGEYSTIVNQTFQFASKALSSQILKEMDGSEADDGNQQSRPLPATLVLKKPGKPIYVPKASLSSKLDAVPPSSILQKNQGDQKAQREK
jgi:hypothetical protein